MNGLLQLTKHHRFTPGNNISYARLRRLGAFVRPWQPRSNPETTNPSNKQRPTVMHSVDTIQLIP